MSTQVRIAGHEIELKNLDKTLFPESGLASHSISRWREPTNRISRIVSCSISILRTMTSARCNGPPCGSRPCSTSSI